jgi:hypothetical protein
LLRSIDRPLLLGIMLVLLVGACTWMSRVPQGRPIRMPENAPQELVHLTLCEPVHAYLDCQKGQCNHWYRIAVGAPGEMRAHVELGEPEGQGALARVVLRPLGQPVLAQQVSNLGEAIDIRQAVERGVYGLLVQGGASARRSYDLRVWVGPPGTPENEICLDAGDSPGT